MSILDIWFRSQYRPKFALVAWYTLWKLLLICIALLSPGPGYDTSTTLLHTNPRLLGTTTESRWDLSARLNNLVRWDAIYFLEIARRGYSWEQEWAFGWGFAKFIALASKGLAIIGLSNVDGNEAAAGIVISHVFHLLSVLMLHELTLVVYPTLSASKRSKLALLAASLHIISPAGMFLSAPYAESCFSFLNFTGFYVYTNTVGSHHQNHVVWRDVSIIFAGLIFGLATTFRGNGLFSGLVLVYDALDCLIKILQSAEIIKNSRRLLVVCISGILMALIAGLPQYLAYREYCGNKSAYGPVRPWCLNWVPSIFAWVQNKYWGVGLLTYWTLSNVPLFILAAPMLYILLQSGSWTRSYDKNIDNDIAYRIAIPQIILAALALISYHVQIVTRLASGYPVWYWWLASLIIDDGNASILGRKSRPTDIITKWMVLYAIVQGGLFASFLPPA